MPTGRHWWLFELYLWSLCAPCCVTSLQGVFYMLYFSVFCDSLTCLTLSELTETSSHALLLLFTLCPIKYHLSWSYYPLHHQKIMAFLCHILSDKRNLWPSEKLSGQNGAKYVEMWEKKIVWDHPTLLFASEIILL